VTPALAQGQPEQLGPREYRVTLRDGATFHDGSPVTAEDVVFSFERIRDEKLGSLYTRFVDFIDTIKPAPGGAAAVDFKLRFETPLLVNRLALVRIMSKRATEAASEDAIATKPVGSGPYEVSRAALGRRVSLVKVDEYNGPKRPALARYDYNVVFDGSARVSGVRTKRFQMSLDIPYKDVEPLDSASGITAQTHQTFTHSDMFVNCGKAPFDDPRVRQALHYAIDREAIRTTVYRGKAENAVGPLPTFHPDFVQPDVIYSHDPARARELLSEAGAGGLEMTLLVSNNYSWLTGSATLMQSQFKEAGITLNVEGGEEQSLVARILEGDYQAWLADGNAQIIGAYDGEFLLRWLYYGFLATGFMYWTGPEQKQVEEVLDRALAATDDAERKQALAEAQNLIVASAPTLPVHYHDLTSAYTNQLTGVRPDGVFGANLRSAKLAA
jgi:peptide/nickel transport system substrate-binding protein